MRVTCLMIMFIAIASEDVGFVCGMGEVRGRGLWDVVRIDQGNRFRENGMYACSSFLGD